MRPASDAAYGELARVVREHAGSLAGSLVHLIGDFATAEDLVQDAVLAALKHWPVEGVPERPDAWLFTVARRRGLDILRREGTYRAKLAQDYDDDAVRQHNCSGPSNPTLTTGCG